MRRILKTAARVLSTDYPRIPPIVGDGRPSDAVGTKALLDHLGMDLSRYGEPITCQVVLDSSSNFFSYLISPTTDMNPTLFVFQNHLYLTMKQLYIPSNRSQIPSVRRDKVFARRDIASITVCKNRHVFEIKMKPKSQIFESTVSGTWRFQSLQMARYLPTWLES